MKKIIFSAIIGIGLFSYSCEDQFLDTKPTGTALFETLANEKGIDGTLTGTYHALLGTGTNASGGFDSRGWSASPSNWVWGSVASDDATKGSSVDDQATIVPIENYSVDASNGYVSDKWNANFDGVSRANDVLNLLGAAKDVSEARATQFKAEALFLRAWFNFELKRVYNKIPFITEKDDPGKVTNEADVWPKIAADLEFAVANLPTTQSQVARPTKYAAEAVLARVYLFMHDYAKAKPLLDDIIGSGKFILMPNYDDNYLIAKRNNAESIYEIQYAVNDGAGSSANASWGDALNFPQDVDGTGTCCGFHQPTQNLVNAFKVDANGLPLLDTFNESNFTNDMGKNSADVFVQDTVTLVDPRLDLTVGRRGVPYLDWGIMRGKDWIRDQNNAGPYVNKKNMFLKSEKNTFSTTTGWATGVNANNYRAYRYAHVLLWRAEVAVQEGTAESLELARSLVNQVRTRAKNKVVMGRTRTFSLPAGVVPKVDYNVPAANYLVGTYPQAGWTKDYAMKAVQFELRLEFGMEGQRFFDLVRWGIADQVLNAYIAKDAQYRELLKGATFTKGKNEYWPIPTTQLELQKGILTQNPGY